MISKSAYRKIFLLRFLGNFLLLSALAGAILTFAPVIKAELAYRSDQLIGRRYVLSGDSSPSSRTTFANLLNIQKPLEITPLDRSFGIIIPKFGANARVVADVDAGDPTIYLEALKKGIAHAKGTVYPGQVGNSYLFAHSTSNFWEVSRWNAVFYLLKDLEPGDEVDLFYKGQRYIYLVFDKKIVEANETGYLSQVANFSLLTLQTCWPPGTTLKRLLVFARLK